MDPRPKPTHLQAAPTLVHEDGGRHHSAAVVTAEKVVNARQKARALTVSSGILRENMMAMVTRQRLQNQDAYHPHAEVRQSCLQGPVTSALTRSLCAVQIQKLVTDRH